MILADLNWGIESLFHRQPEEYVLLGGREGVAKGWTVTFRKKTLVNAFVDSENFQINREINMLAIKFSA